MDNYDLKTRIKNILEKKGFKLEGNDNFSGQFGTVYFVEDSQKSKLAVKVIDLRKGNIEDDQKKEDAIEEANIMKHSNHKNVVRFFESFTQESLFFIIMERAQMSLEAFIKNELQDRYISEEEFFYFSRQIIEGIMYTHNRNIILRDLKPSNILVFQDNKLKLTDFGLSKEFLNEDFMNQYIQKEFKGCKFYFPPEIWKMLLESQVNNNLKNNEFKQNKKGDIWALGISLLQLAKVNTVVLMKLSMGQIEMPDLENVTQKMKLFLNFILKKNEEERPTIEEVKMKLNKICSQEFNDSIENKLQQQLQIYKQDQNAVLKAQQQKQHGKRSTNNQPTINNQQKEMKYYDNSNKEEMNKQNNQPMNTTQLQTNRFNATQSGQQIDLPLLFIVNNSPKKNKVQDSKTILNENNQKYVDQIAQQIEQTLQYQNQQNQIKEYFSQIHQISSHFAFSLRLNFQGKLNNLALKSLSEGLSLLTNLSSLHLDLSNNIIDSTGFTSISGGLKQLTNLFSLDLNLSFNKFRSSEIDSLSKSLTLNLNSLALNLNSSSVDTKGAESISQGLKQLQNLNSLDLNLENNKMKSSGIVALSEGLKSLSYLTSLQLHLRKNKINSPAAKSISKGLKFLTNLSYLCLKLEDNRIESYGTISLSKELKLLPNLIDLQIDMNNNFVGIAGALSLNDLKDQLPKLKNIQVILGKEFTPFWSCLCCCLNPCLFKNIDFE